MLLLVQTPSLTAQASFLLLGTLLGTSLRRLDLAVWVVFAVWGEDYREDYREYFQQDCQKDCQEDYQQDHREGYQEDLDVLAEFHGRDRPRKRDDKSLEGGACIPVTILKCACGLSSISPKSSS